MAADFIDSKLFRQVREVTYLTVENAWRYRTILRYFYLQHERLRHFLFPEEVYAYLTESDHFADYTEEQLEQDLKQLVEWNNLIPRQETGRVSSIEEFKRRRFRYQCSPYTVEFERTVSRLERMGESFGGSLESTLFDRLLASIFKLEELGVQLRSSERTNLASGPSPREVNQIWEDIRGNFRNLMEQSTDYLAHLKGEKAETLMQTDAFLVYKDSMTEYLRTFMISMQRTSYKIEAVVREIPAETIGQLASLAAQYQRSIPRLDERPDQASLEQQVLDEWDSLSRWFFGTGSTASELTYLQNETNEAIRRITRFAQRIGERYQVLRSRRKDCLHLAGLFGQMTDLREAHKLSACAFGVFHTRHLVADQKTTDDIYAQLWDEPSTIVTIKPRIRQYRMKTRPGAVISRSQEKRAALEQYLRERAAERLLIDQLIVNGQIAIAAMPVVDTPVRKTLLNWVGKCMARRDRTIKTEHGRRVRLETVDGQRVDLRCTDGTLDMPNYVFRFLN